MVDPDREQDLRDWFAGLAMQGLLQSFNGDFELDDELLTNRAYELAEAMMESRNDT
jgi:hypothetical protein